MKAWLPLSLLLLLPAACDALPRDPDQTSETVARVKRIRAGIATGGSHFDASETARLLARLSVETGARIESRSGDTEPLLQALEQGDLDIVVAPFDDKTPWATRVALSPPMAASGPKDRRIELRAAMRNGENRWIMRVEKAARAVAQPGAES